MHDKIAFGLSYGSDLNEKSWGSVSYWKRIFWFVSSFTCEVVLSNHAAYLWKWNCELDDLNGLKKKCYQELIYFAQKCFQLDFFLANFHVLLLYFCTHDNSFKINTGWIFDSKLKIQ